MNDQRLDVVLGHAVILASTLVCLHSTTLSTTGRFGTCLVLLPLGLLLRCWELNALLPPAMGGAGNATVLWALRRGTFAEERPSRSV